MPKICPHSKFNQNQAISLGFRAQIRGQIDLHLNKPISKLLTFILFFALLRASVTHIREYFPLKHK